MRMSLVSGCQGWLSSKQQIQDAGSFPCNISTIKESMGTVQRGLKCFMAVSETGHVIYAHTELPIIIQNHNSIYLDLSIYRLWLHLFIGLAKHFIQVFP